MEREAGETPGAGRRPPRTRAIKAILAAVAGTGAEIDRLVLPGSVKRREVGGIRIGQLKQRRDFIVLRLRRGERDQRPEHRFVGRLALAQALRHRGEDVRRLAERVAGLLRRQQREIFQEQRHEIRQLGRAHEKVMLLVLRLEIDHGLAAIAAFAMHVFKQMQRQRTRAIEQQHVALLQVVEIAGGDFSQQRVQLVADARRDHLPGIDRLADLAGRLLQLDGRIGQQYRERLQGLDHHTTSIGVLARLGVPNRLVSVVPPEQPLPNEKPQEPRRS